MAKQVSQIMYKNQIKVFCLDAEEENIISLRYSRRVCISLLMLHSKITFFSCGTGEDLKSMEPYCVGGNGQKSSGSRIKKIVPCRALEHVFACMAHT